MSKRGTPIVVEKANGGSFALSVEDSDALRDIAEAEGITETQALKRLVKDEYVRVLKIN